MDNSKYIVLDIETNGLDEQKYDILSISIYDPYSNETYNKYLPLTKHKTVLTTNINGITKSKLTNSTHYNQNDINELISKFNIENRKVLTFGKLDEKFLKVYFKEHNLIGIEKFDFFNIKDLFATNKYITTGVFTKDNLCKAFNIEGVTDIHSSINDCILEWKLFEKISGKPTLIYENNMYEITQKYCLPVTTIINYPNISKHINDFPKFHIEYNNIYTYEIDLHEDLYLDNYLFGFTIENFLNSKLNTTNIKNENFLIENKSNLNKYGNFPFVNYTNYDINYTTDGELFLENNTDKNAERWVVTINKLINKIKDKLDEPIKYIKQHIFNNDSIWYQEIVKNNTLNTFAICDFSNKNAVLEVKGNLNYNISNNKLQFFIEANNRNIYLLRCGINERKFIISIEELSIICSNNRRKASEIVQTIRNWRINNNIPNEIIYNCTYAQECSNQTGIDINTINKYFKFGCVDYKKEDLEEFLDKKTYKDLYVDQSDKYFYLNLKNTIDSIIRDYKIKTRIEIWEKLPDHYKGIYGKKTYTDIYQNKYNMFTKFLDFINYKD